MNEAKIATHLHPSSNIKTSELTVLFGLVILSCHDHKVKREFLAEVVELALEGQRLIAGLGAEARMFAACDLPEDEKAKKMFEDMAIASMMEIDGLRKKLSTKMGSLMSCAGPEDSIS